MRTAISLLFIASAAVPLLIGCGNGNTGIGTCSGAECPAIITPVSLSMTDTPPSGVSVLSFEVKLSAATLNPASGSPVSLLPTDSDSSGSSTPIAIDLTQLQAVSQFLSTVNVAPGAYSSLSLTFSDPRLVIYNASNSAISGSCAIGSVCQIAPAMDGSATVNISASPFPVSALANSPLGFIVDFHLGSVLQPDFSLNLSATNGITAAEIPLATNALAPQLDPLKYGAVSGTVRSTNSGSDQFVIQTPDNRIYTIESNGGTTYDDFPASACSIGSVSCLTNGQAIRVQVDGLGPLGDLTASQVTYVQTTNQQTVEGTIINIVPSPTNIAGAPPLQLSLLIHGNPSNGNGLTPGAVATVTFAANPSYSINAEGFSLPAGLAFSNGSDLLVGQNVQMDIVPGSLSPLSGQAPSANWNAPQSVSFTTDSVSLEPTQLTATITAIDSSALSLTADASTGPAFLPWPLTASGASSFNVLTTAQTAYHSASQVVYVNLADKDLVSVSGWLFPPALSGEQPTLAAQTIVLRSTGTF